MRRAVGLRWRDRQHQRPRYGFEVVGLRQIVDAILPDNPASRRVLEKLGMHYAGRGDDAGFPLDVFVIERGGLWSS